MKRILAAHEIIFSDEIFAQNYARRHQKMSQQFGREYVRKLKSRGFQSGRIIDVGCGAGGTALVLAQAFPACEVLGIDLSDPLLRLARESASQANLIPQVQFEKADVREMPYPDQSFDVVLNLNMVHLVQLPCLMLNEIARILKTGGILFMADLRRSWWGLLEREIKAALTLAEAQALIQQSKLSHGIFTTTGWWWRFEK